MIRAKKYFAKWLGVREIADEANAGGRAGCKVWKNEGWDKGECRADLHTKM